MPGGWTDSTRRAELPPDWFTHIRPRILKRDPVCAVCRSRPSAQVDHIRRGHDHRDSNLQGICDSCHKDKSSREGVDARREIRSARWRPRPTHPGIQ
jgi:5-methylcytosine-specific restriction protein A